MSKLSSRHHGGNLNPEGHDDYVARPSGHPDGSGSFEDDHELHLQMLAQLEHDQAIDIGDDAVNAGAACAEARLRQAFPKQPAFSFVREQVRIASTGCGAEFFTRWRIFLADLRISRGDTLDPAVDARVAQATPADAETTKRPA